MDVETFASEPLSALAQNGLFKQITLDIDEDIASGRVHISERQFLRLYFNGITDVMAFALIDNERRIWGIDRDNIRGWHLHPADNPDSHVAIEPLTIPEITARLAEVVSNQS